MTRDGQSSSTEQESASFWKSSSRAIARFARHSVMACKAVPVPGLSLYLDHPMSWPTRAHHLFLSLSIMLATQHAKDHDDDTCLAFEAAPGSLPLAS